MGKGLINEHTLNVEKIGLRVAKCRKARGYTQEELAMELGVKVATIRAYEHRNIVPSASALVAMAKIFKTSTDYLLTGFDNVVDSAICIDGLTDDEVAIIQELINKFNQLHKN